MSKRKPGVSWPDTDRKCSKCGSGGPFGAMNQSKDGLYPQCKPCQKQSGAKWAAENKEWRKITRSVWYNKNRDAAQSVNRKWYSENTERIAAARSAWHQANPDIWRASWRKRRALKRTTEADNVIPQQVFERDGWVCYLCMKPVNRNAKFPAAMSAVMDHVIPLADGGPHTLANLACAHRICNSRKGARPWHEVSVMLT